MIIEDISEFKGLIEPYKRLLGLDVGEKTIGLALSDINLTIATPLETIRRKKFTTDVEILAKVVRDNDVAGLVIGLPVNMDGTEGPKCQSVRQFARNLLKNFEINILFWDERMSTMAVTKTLLDADMSRQKRSQVVDKMAASYILQGVLDCFLKQ